MMSESIQKLLGPMKPCLQTYIKEAKIMFLHHVIKNDLDGEEMEVECLIPPFSSNITLLERCNQDWATLLHEIKDNESAAEEE